MNNFILGTRVDPTNYEVATQQILSWANIRQGRYVCIANVHMLMEAHDSDDFQRVVNGGDLVTPDGMPLVWTLRILGHTNQSRVYGPDLTLRIIEAAAKEVIPVGLYGSRPEIIEKMVQAYHLRFPDLRVVYSFSPPFRVLSSEEDKAIIEKINASGVRILFVGLGCPKQERWMADHRGVIQAVMLGVGAAFDFHSKTKRQAPEWMQKLGLEWLFRLSQEPVRLWKRYLYNNPRFFFLVVRQLLFRRK
jgi:N-acetylglucosaminyldiphosphoundecaprenol N-acetyl-beta-D-mannosaminyltransferase